MLQKVLRNTGWLVADKALRLIVSLFVTAWVARYLGPQGYGLFNYAAALVALLGAISALGLEGILVREFVRDQTNAVDLLGTALALRLVGGLGVLAASFLLAFWLQPGNYELRVLVGVLASGSVFQAFDVFDQWFQSQLLSKRTVLAKNIAFLVMAVVKVVLILMRAPLLAFAWAVAAESALGALTIALAYEYRGGSLRSLRVHLAMARKLIGESWPLIISGMAIGIYMRIDQVMLGQMLGNAAVGIYSAATRLTEFSYIIPTMIVASASPALFSLRNTNEALFLQRLEQLLRVLTALALAIALPTTLLSTLIIRLLYGNSYAESATVLAVHVWAAVFVFSGVAQHSWFLAEGLVKLTAVRTVIGALANIGLNLVMIPRYGPVGAAVATLVSFALSAMLINALSARTRALFFMQLRAFQIWKMLKT
ncbi:MAG: flippase [Acidiferrobacteraceae bacterium]